MTENDVEHKLERMKPGREKHLQAVQRVPVVINCSLPKYDLGRNGKTLLDNLDSNFNFFVVVFLSRF